MELTKNYKLKKLEGTDVVNVEDFNDNADVLDGKLKELETEVEATKKSVSDGKKTVADAITAKGQTTAADAAFEQMAANIGKIETESVLTGTAAAAQVLAGATFYNTDPKSRQTGTMPTLGGSIFGDSGSVNSFDNSPIVHAASNDYVGAFDYSLHGYFDNNAERVHIPNLIPGNIKAGVKIGGKNGYIEGTFTSDGTITASQVLQGYVAYSKGNKITGDLHNHGGISQSLNAGSSYTIPAGYHNGNGKVTANALSGQTSGSATAGQIYNGYTAWVNGAYITGTMAVQSILSFSAAVYSSTAITFTWKNPAKGLFAGICIVGRTGTYPTSVTDGTQYYWGYGSNASASGSSSVTLTAFSPGETYYFRAYSYTMVNGSLVLHDTTFTATAATTKGQVAVTSSGTWTVPAGVRTIDVFCVGGGAGGKGGLAVSASATATGGGGGGSGYTATMKSISVTPGQQIACTIGAGGEAVSGNTSSTQTYNSNYAGGTTSFGSYVSVAGGNRHTGSSNRLFGTSGGSGGGGSGARNDGKNGGAGGADGGYGYNMYGNKQAAGQDSTTRAFGEPNNTLYAGGGGGGAAGSSSYVAGAGGAGGGGAGGAYGAPSAAGTNGTGSGGGGGTSISGYNTGAAGGSGVILIRWGY